MQSNELLVFVTSGMSRKQHILQPFEDTLSPQCSSFTSCGVEVQYTQCYSIPRKP